MQTSRPSLRPADRGAMPHFPEGCSIMNPRLSPVAEIYRVNTGLFPMALADLSDEQARTRPGPGANAPLWIASHLIGSRALVARLAGGSYEFRESDRFARGRPPGDPAELPSLAELSAHWQSVSEVVLARFPRLGDEDLDAEVEGRYPIEQPGVLGALAFLALHESYHLGQLGYLRKLLGLPGVVG
jgi:hypothetical protein